MKSRVGKNKLEAERKIVVAKINDNELWTEEYSK